MGFTEISKLILDFVVFVNHKKKIENKIIGNLERIKEVKKDSKTGFYHYVDHLDVYVDLQSYNSLTLMVRNL